MCKDMDMDRVRRVLTWLTVLGWVTFVPASLGVGVDHPARVLVQVYGVGVVGVSMLLAQCLILPNLMGAYLLGVGDRRPGPEPGKPAEVVKIRRVS